MRLCWADKVPLLLLTALVLVLLWFGGVLSGHNDTEYCHQLVLGHPTWTSADSYCFVTDEEHWGAFFSITWSLFLKFIAPIWVVLRITDFFLGGPYHRRAKMGLPPGICGPGYGSPSDNPGPAFIQEALDRRVREWDATHARDPSRDFDLKLGEWTRSERDWTRPRR
jgi:hypothetical protein